MAGRACAKGNWQRLRLRARANPRRGWRRAVEAKSEGPAPELYRRVSTKLNGCSIMLVGDDESGAKEVADMLARGLGYTPLHTMDVLQKVKGQTLDGMEREEGPSSVILGEAEVLESLSTFVRCVVTTWGSGYGAAARGDCWRYLYAGVTVWLDTELAARADRGDDMPHRRAYELAEVWVTAQGTGTAEEGVGHVAERVLRGVERFVDDDPEVCNKKSLYVRLGCRGDWPNIQLPDSLTPGDNGNNA